MKKLFTILCSSLYLFAHAQTTGQPILSLGGGLNSPNSEGKANANLINSYAFNGHVYVPLFAKGDNGGLAGHTSHFITVGLNAGAEYFAGSKAYDLNALPSYPITGQSAAPSIALNTNRNKQNDFKAEAGIQANFSFGKVTFSPMVNAGYMSWQQKALHVTQTSSVNGKTYSREIYNKEDLKTSGFALAPKLRIAYFPGKLGFYVEGNYTNGPTVNSEAMLFKPQGSANADGFYSQDQMAMGSMQRVSQNTSYNSFGLNLGVSIPLGKSISEKGVKRSAERASDKLPPRTYTGGRKNESAQMVPGNPIGGIIVKGGKNPGGSFITVITNANGEFEFTATEAGNYRFSVSDPAPQGKSINEKGVKRAEAAKQTQGLTFGEKVGQGLAADARPGSPIGGIVVKGGKNPGGNPITVSTNENGEFELENLEAGNYKFTITAPENPQGKSISTKGVSGPKGGKN